MNFAIDTAGRFKYNNAHIGILCPRTVMKAMTDEKRLSKLDIDGVKARVRNLPPRGV